jgi:hypothetical protein
MVYRCKEFARFSALQLDFCKVKVKVKEGIDYTLSFRTILEWVSFE